MTKISKTAALKKARTMVGPLVKWGHNDWRYTINEDGRGWRETRGRGYFSSNASRGETIREIAADLLAAA